MYEHKEEKRYECNSDLSRLIVLLRFWLYHHWPAQEQKEDTSFSAALVSARHLFRLSWRAERLREILPALWLCLALCRPVPARNNIPFPEESGEAKQSNEQWQRLQSLSVIRI